MNTERYLFTRGGPEEAYQPSTKAPVWGAKKMAYPATAWPLARPGRRRDCLGSGLAGSVDRASPPAVRAFQLRAQTLAEEACGRYISNGAFIVACTRKGYRVAPCGPNSPNAWVWLRVLQGPKNIGLWPVPSLGWRARAKSR